MRAEAAGAAGVRAVLRVPELRALLAASGLSTLGDQITRIAVAVLVFERTDSAFFASATMAVSYLTWLVGGPFLAALADRWRRKPLMVGCDLVRAALIACLVVPDLPLWTVFVLLTLAGVLAPPFDSAKSAVLPDVLPDPAAYATGNALLGALQQGATVLGFAVGGLLVTALGPEGALVVDAATFALSALLLAAGLHARDAAAPTGQTLVRETRDGFSLVLRSPRLRLLLAYGALGSLPVIAPEGLAVPVADALDGGGGTAGLLTAALPAGFLVGSWLVLRVEPDRRDALLPALTALSCLPLLLTAAWDSTAGVVVLWAVAGAFSAAQLVANASYMLAAPPHARGRAFGVAVTAIMATQGLALLAVGSLAELVDPRSAVALAALGALVALGVLRLVGGLPVEHRSPGTGPGAQATDDLCRSTAG